MNKTISNLTREKIKEGLNKVPDAQKIMFKRMYGDVDDSIDEVVDNMPDKKIDLALTQVENTLKKL